MPLLHFVQSIDGYVTQRGIETIAAKLDLAAAEVTDVSSFYTQYKSEPVGEYHVGVCTNTLCAVMGGDAIYESVCAHLGIKGIKQLPMEKFHSNILSAMLLVISPQW